MPKPPPGDGPTPLTPNVAIASPATGAIYKGGTQPEIITVTGTAFLTCDDPGGQCDVGAIDHVDVQLGDSAPLRATLNLDASPAQGTEQSGSWSFTGTPPPTAFNDMQITATLTALEGTRRRRYIGQGSASVTVTILGAGWSAPTGLGGVKLTSAPVAVTGGEHILDVFYRGPNNHLWTSWWDGSPWWSAPTDLGGVELTSAPAAVTIQYTTELVDKLSVFYRGPNNHLWISSWGDQGWSTPRDLGGVELTSGPAAATGGEHILDVFYRGPNNHLWTTWWDDQGQSVPTDLGGVELTSGPTAATGGEHILDVFHRGPNNHLWASYWDGGPWWSAPVDLGGVELASEPGVTRHALHRLDVLYRGPNSHLWTSWWPSGDVWYDAQTDRPAPNPLAYDLLTREFDDNGIPLNPVLGSQTWLPSQLADPSLCGQGVSPWACTKQVIWFDRSWKCAGYGLGGHANWGLVTYEGRVYWHDHSYFLLDDDYSFAIYRDDLAGMTADDVRNLNYLHCEFNSNQTINYFHTWYWDQLHAAVDDDGGKGGPRHYPWPKTWPLFNGKRAIVMGLFGLDCAHACGSELHPVYALAIQLSDSIEHETWAIFVRNWGDEGFCSEGQEMIDPGEPFRFIFRFRRPDATDVSIIPAADSDPAGQYGTVFYAAHEASGTGYSGPRLVPNEGALVAFDLPPASDRQRINGMLHLRWQVSTETASTPVAETGELVSSTGVEDGADKPENEPEKILGQLIEEMSPAQREFLDQLHSREPIQRDSVKLQVQPFALRQEVMPGRVLNVPDEGRNQRDLQSMEALRALLGDRVPRPPDGDDVDEGDDA